MYKPRHKFNNVRTTIDDIKFSSKLEASYYKHLKNLQAANDVIFFLRQVPFHLPGGVKYIVDFQVFYTDGWVDFVDTKGMKTDTFILKKKLVESQYPVTISVLEKGDF